MKQHTFRRMLSAVMLVVLAAASATCGGAKDEPAASEPVTLKVMYYEEGGFFREYGELLMMKFPGIDFEVVSTTGLYANSSEPYDPEAALIKLIEERNPDLLFLNEYQYAKFYQEGRLVNLEPKIEADGYDIETIAPGVIDMLRERAGGQLHGLAPTFQSQALFYNVDLFDEYGIPHPTDRMTWEEVIQLARRFPTGGSGDDRIYGINFDTYTQPTEILNLIARTEGLMLADPVTKQMTVKNENWARALSMVAELYRSGIAPSPQDPSQQPAVMSYEDYLFGNPFSAGKSAMTINGPYFLDQLRQAAQHSPDRAVNYEVVTMPADPVNRERGGSFDVYQIFAISATSDAQNAAWEVLKFINSGDVARIKSRSSTNLLSRMGYAERNGRSIEAFYGLKPPAAPPIYFDESGQLPGIFIGTVYSVLSRELAALINGEKTVDDVLDILHDEGQKALLAAETAPPPGDPATGAADVHIGIVEGDADGAEVDTP